MDNKMKSLEWASLGVLAVASVFLLVVLFYWCRYQKYYPHICNGIVEDRRRTQFS